MHEPNPLPSLYPLTMTLMRPRHPSLPSTCQWKTMQCSSWALVLGLKETIQEAWVLGCVLLSEDFGNLGQR